MGGCDSALVLSPCVVLCACYNYVVRVCISIMSVCVRKSDCVYVVHAA